MRALATLSAATVMAATLMGFQPSAEAQAYLAEPPIAAVFVYHGQRYCFAPDGWHGPGWYRCGYPHRPGFGWGGPVGWHGWRAPWPGGGWNPRWGHGPAVVSGGWHPHGWHAGGRRPHGDPHRGHPPHGHPEHHGHPHPHGHGAHRHRH